jgi:hypothetical protein
LVAGPDELGEVALVHQQGPMCLHLQRAEDGRGVGSVVERLNESASQHVYNQCRPLGGVAVVLEKLERLLRVLLVVQVEVRQQVATAQELISVVVDPPQILS